jgi:uncharacterized MnhB-related membrane protein
MAISEGEGEMKFSAQDYLLLVICIVLVCFGLFMIVTARRLFGDLIGAGIFAAGGSACYLILAGRNQFGRP